ERTQALLERLRHDAIDGMLVTNLPNVRYLTGFSGTSAMLLVTAVQRWLFTDFRYAVQAQAEAGSVADIVVETSSLWRGVWETLRGTRNLHSLGFESAHMPHRDFERLLKDGSAWTWMPLIDVIERLREVKDEGELSAIRDAGKVAAVALEKTLGCVTSGMTELQVAGVLEHALRDAGSEVAPFASIVASGERTALPHARAGRRAIARGDFLLLDFGATVNGYVSDVTRTVVVGRADERQRQVHAAVQAANEAARTRVRSGMTGKEADAIARGVLEQYGLNEAFGHGLGHGIGLEVHEGPRLSRISEQVLQEGAVVTIEPGVYVTGWGGVRIEDNVRLSAQGAELLTEMPRHLIELS
ncbi:MAG: Xaa-Pro peptidase family protein, partial [Gemmatimonadota bacterium]